LRESRTDFNEVGSSTEAQRGVTERRKTAGEARFQEGHGAVRRGDKQSLVADFIVDTFQNLSKLLQETLTVPQVIKIIGKPGIFWTEVSREDIQGEFQFEVEVSELQPRIPEIDRRELSDFILSLSQFLAVLLQNPISLQVFNLQGLVSEFAKNYPSINVEKIMNMQVSPKQIAEMAMMQMQQGGGNGGE